MRVEGRSGRDLLTGRILPLVVWSVLLATELPAVTRALLNLSESGLREEPVLAVARHLLTLAFFVLVLWAYLARTRVRAAASGFRERVLPMTVFLAGPVGIFLLQRFPTPPMFSAPRVAVLISVAGLGLSVWSLSHLSGAFSILAEARQVVTSGPYRFVRHPLYLGEALTMLGLCLLIGTFPALALWLVVNGFQLIRARIEEEKLCRELADYRAYRERTRFILPGLY